jgi:hypothetical protein
MKRLLLVVFFTIVMASQLNAQSTLVLQEKCMKAAKEFFVSGGYSTAKDAHWSFTCHYNKKLDKCFILTTGLVFERDKQSMYNFLDDVFEGKNYGNYVAFASDDNSNPGGLKPFYCNVKDQFCWSKPEFEALIRPYMEE